MILAVKKETVKIIIFIRSSFVFYSGTLFNEFFYNEVLALFLRPDLEKEKNKELIWPGAVRLKTIILRAVIQSWNFADLDLYIGGETGELRNLPVGFRQCKTIIMPLIPISCSSVSCCRRCLRCAKRCSFCSSVSCWRLLLRCSRWIWSRRQNAPWSSAAKSMLPGNAKCSMTSPADTKHIFRERFMKPRISQLAKTTRG